MKFVDTAKLTEAFKLLRKEGVVAKQRFSCCNSCASYEIAAKFGTASQTKREKNMKGCVFYHRQNAERLKTGGDLYISYGQIIYHVPGLLNTCIQSTLTSVEVGKLAQRVFESVGLKCLWDGTPEKKIQIKAE